jgi:hypothetical protein
MTIMIYSILNAKKKIPSCTLCKWGQIMHKSLSQHATLPNLTGAHLPPVELSIDARFQFAVNCGAQSAIVFFEEDQAISLHAHLPASLEYFMMQSRRGALALGVDFSETAKECQNAFVAGYLGRVQQELRIMQPSRQTAASASRSAFH